MNVLIYKRTHRGDPHPETGGIFGVHTCMKRVRGWPVDAVIGVGGIRPWPEDVGIARKLNWVGIGPQIIGTGEDGYPLLAFEHFLFYDEKGPLLDEIAPELAKRIYDGNVRLIWSTKLSDKEREDVMKILDLAKVAPSSDQSGAALTVTTTTISGERRSESRSGSSAVRKIAREKTGIAEMKRETVYRSHKPHCLSLLN